MGWRGLVIEINLCLYVKLPKYTPALTGCAGQMGEMVVAATPSGHVAPHGDRYGTLALDYELS